MNEREVIRSYRTLEKKEEYKPYVENIEKVKSIVTPKKNMELKSLLVGASEKEGTLRRYILATLDKKLDGIHRDESKEGKESRQWHLDNEREEKISRRRSIRNIKLKKPRKYTLRKAPRVLSRIEEGDEESSSKSPRRSSPRSTWRTTGSSPRSPRRATARSPRSPRSANKTQKKSFWSWLGFK